MPNRKNTKKKWPFTRSRLRHTHVGCPERMAVSAGVFFTAAVSEDGSLFAWGGGAHGRLGTGNTRNRHAPTRVAGLSSARAAGRGWGYPHGHSNGRRRPAHVRCERLRAAGACK